MAEVTSSSSKDTFPKASAVNSATSVVAAPKFVFGSGMSERVKKSDDEDDDESDVSDKEEQSESGLLERASEALKRSADSDDDSADPACSDSLFSPKKMLKTEKSESKSENVLRPSALSDIANKLTNTKHRGSDRGTDDVKTSGNVKQDDSSAKTCGECSNSSSSSSESSTRLSRPHLIDTPAQLNTVGGQAENYFHQFFTSNSLTSSTKESEGAFVFGQNLRDRVNVEQSGSADVPTKVPKEGDSPQSLAELADKGGSSISVETSQSSIAAAAQKYEKEHSPKKQNLVEVQVVTGEEDERNVVQVNCRLFSFCKDTHSWLGRGRVILKLNDHRELNSEGTFHSRLVARTQGSLRLVLNTKLWPDMVIEKASDKAIRVSAMGEDGHIQLYLVMAPAREAMQLFTAIDRRILTLKREQTLQDSEEEQTDTTKNDVSPTIDHETKDDQLPKQNIPNESEKN